MLGFITISCLNKKLHNFVGQLSSAHNFSPHYKLEVDGR